MSTTYTSLIDSDGQEWRVWVDALNGNDVLAITSDGYDDWTDETYSLDSWTDETYP